MFRSRVGPAVAADVIRDSICQQMGCDPKAFNEQIDRLLFRRGFLLTTADSTEVARLPYLGRWSRQALGRYSLYLHPDAKCRVRSQGTRIAVVIGQVFDPEEYVFDEDPILDGLLNTQIDGAFFSILDRLAGRFALVMIDRTSTRVFHDAFGAMPVFYAEGEGGHCASHSGLLADLLAVPLREFVIPFITSDNYRARDVKYLPGLAAPYEGILQLTPNTTIDLVSKQISRYWPRGPLTKTDLKQAAEMLSAHLAACAEFTRRRRWHPALGLTGGSDSRGIFAACATLNPFVFTYVRSSDGTQNISKDSLIGGKLAAAYGIRQIVFPIPNRHSLSSSISPFGEAFRRSTGYYRGNSSAWVEALYAMNEIGDDSLFIRGFGGEILRGFYQHSKNRIRSMHPNQLASAYGVNAGSPITRALFEHFLEVSQWSDQTLYDYDLNDIFYWEHRMGVWGSIAMTESALAVHGIVGYNSRNLYNTFFGLEFDIRASREALHMAIRELAPVLSSEIYGFV
jgi:hypothetical protein